MAPNDMLRFEPSSARRRFGVAQALARPGFMTLRCVRRDGRLVDFAWEFASTAVARLLCAGHADLRGKLLSDVFGDQPGHALVFARYRHVVENGTGDTFEQAHHLDGVEDLCRHVAMRLGDGVAVTLVNRDAIGRARALEREVRTWPTAYRAAAVA